MIKPVGGRGQKAPYQTTQMRVPLPLKAEFEKRIAEFRETVLTGNKPEDRYLVTVESAADSVLADPTVTRNGKDRGACKRALDALIQRLDLPN